MSQRSDYVMYIVVNHSLGMGKGKSCSQAGHAVQKVIEYLLLDKRVTAEQTKLYQAWRHSGMAKITVKANAEQMVELEAWSETPTGRTEAHVVHDAGLTQIPAGSLTAIACLPMRRDSEAAQRFVGCSLL